MTPTAARPRQREDAHWYYTDGRPCYELPKKSGPGMKVPNIKDARELNLMPSVTTILKVLAKWGLVNWMIEQAILAVLTSPRKPGEKDDEFVDRIINVEMVQDQERDAAAKRGVSIHGAMELWFSGRREEIPPDVLPWITPAATAVARAGEFVTSEKCLVGPDFAGRTDLILRSHYCWRIWDWKNTKKLPDPKYGAWPEHKLQLSAYGKAFLDKLPQDEPVQTISVGNVYISSVRCGEYVICETTDWLETYERGFRPIVQYWQWANGYAPVV